MLFAHADTARRINGTNVADVMLECEPIFPVVGCATLKSILKLSYTNMERGKCLFLVMALLVRDLTIFRVVWVDDETPMCTKSSTTPSGVHFDSRKKPMTHCSALKLHSPRAGPGPVGPRVGPTRPCLRAGLSSLPQENKIKYFHSY